MGVLGPEPHVHPWMVGPAGPVRRSTSALATVGERVDSAGRRLQTVLAEAGGVLGWRSSGAQAARVPVVQAGARWASCVTWCRRRRRR